MTTEIYVFVILGLGSCQACQLCVRAYELSVFHSADLASHLDMLRHHHMLLPSILPQQLTQITTLHLIPLLRMLFEKHGCLTRHAYCIDFTASCNRLDLVDLVMCLCRGWSRWLVLQRLICLDHESFMLQNLHSITSKLDEIIASKQLIALRQMWIWILLHDSRLAVVMSRVRVQISQVLGHVLSLPQISHIVPYFRISTGKLSIESISLRLWNLVRIVS